MAINKVIYGDRTLIDLSSDTATPDVVADGFSLHLANGVRAMGTARYASSPVPGGSATKALAIPSGILDISSTSTVMTATVTGITELYDGVCVVLKNGVVRSASGVTLDINGLGAKPIYDATKTDIRITNQFGRDHTWLFVYDSSRVEGGCWLSYWGVTSEDIPTRVSELVNDTDYVSDTLSNEDIESLLNLTM